MSHWLVKQEPESYAWEQFVRDGRTVWDGVRNFQARNNLRAMRRGDSVLFYASGSSKSVIGLARVSREGFADPSAKNGDWTAVELEAMAALEEPVPLARIKATPALRDAHFLRHTRLSVVALTPAQFDAIVKLGGGVSKRR